MEAQEYKDILKAHGRRVANRVAFASLPANTERTLGDFYACYGDEASLPEHERCSTGMIKRFDPVGLRHHYARDHWGAAAMQFVTSDGELIKAFCKMDAQWRYFVAAYVLVMNGEQRREAMLAALDVTPENEPFLEALHDLCESETFVADRVALHISITGKWPEPGTHEAEELMECAK